MKDSHFQDQTLTPTVKKKRKRRVKEFVESPVTANSSAPMTGDTGNISKTGVNSPCMKENRSSVVNLTVTHKRSQISEKGRVERKGKEKVKDKVKQKDKHREEWRAATSQISNSSVDVSSFLLGLDELLPDIEVETKPSEGLPSLIFFFRVRFGIMRNMWKHAIIPIYII